MDTWASRLAEETFSLLSIEGIHWIVGISCVMGSEKCTLFFCRDLILSNIHCNDFEYTKIHCKLRGRKDPKRMLLIHWIRKHAITQEWFFHLLFPPLKLNVGSICPSIVLGDNIYSYNIWRRHSSSEVSSYWTMTPAQPKLTLNSNFVFKDREIIFSD